MGFCFVGRRGGGIQNFQTGMDFSSPPFQPRGAQKSRRGGWQESASSSSGIVFAAATNKIRELKNAWKNATNIASPAVWVAWLGSVIISRYFV